MIYFHLDKLSLPRQKMKEIKCFWSKPKIGHEWNHVGPWWTTHICHKCGKHYLPDQGE